MGFFSGRRKQSESQNVQSNITDYVNVLVRLPSSEYVNGSGNRDSLWSLCVGQLPATQNISEKSGQRKSSKSKPNENHKTGNNDTQARHQPSPTKDTEFSLVDGQLYISPLSWSNSNPTTLKIQLPLNTLMTTTSQSSTNHPPLPHRIERTLQTLNQTTSHLPNSTTGTNTWIRLCLITLQQSNILPSGKTFNVNDFMSYAENQITEFEAELISSSHVDGDDDNSNNSVVKIVNYQAHLDENARLREVIGRGRRDEDGFSADINYNSNSEPYASVDDEDDHDDGVERKKIKGGGGGLIKGWWITRPGDRRINGNGHNNGRDLRQQKHRDDERGDSYGGLM